MQRTAILVGLVLAACAHTRGPTHQPAATVPQEEQNQEETAAPPTEDQEEPDVVTGVEQELVDIRSLCEPAADRWPWPTRDQREHAKEVIIKTCRAMGADANSCKFFQLVSVRESSYRWWVRHKMAGDRASALRSYMSTARRYGWEATWDRKARKAEDTSAIQLEPVGDLQNMYYMDPERFLSSGLGLGGLNISYHLARFDPQAPPEILCDPVVNVVVQMAIARSAVQDYGARNFYEIQAVYAGRTTFDGQGRVRPLSCSRGCPFASPRDVARARKADAATRRRCEGVGMDCLAVPKLGRRLGSRDTTPEDRYRFADEIRGAPLPPFDAPPNGEANRTSTSTRLGES